MIDRLVAERDCLELYDLAQDPTETINLAGQPDLAALERTLLSRLRQLGLKPGCN
jgi:hypothetical protein